MSDAINRGADGAATRLPRFDDSSVALDHSWELPSLRVEPIARTTLTQPGRAAVVLSSPALFNFYRAAVAMMDLQRELGPDVTLIIHDPSNRSNSGSFFVVEPTSPGPTLRPHTPEMLSELLGIDVDRLALRAAPPRQRTTEDVLGF